MSIKQTLEAARAFANANARELAEEEIEWQDTAILRDGKMRELARMLEDIEAHSAMRLAQSIAHRAALDALVKQPVKKAPAGHPAAQALDFIIEKRGKFWILDWAAKGGEGCRPASEPEIQMWQALSAQPEQAKKGNVQQSIIGWLCSRDSTVTVEVRCENLARYVSRDEDYKPFQRWSARLYADGQWRSYQWDHREGGQPTAEEREAILLKLLQNAMGA